MDTIDTRDSDQGLMTIREVAERLRVSRKWVDRAIAGGRLEAIRLGPRTIRVTREAFERFVNYRQAA